MTGSPKRRPKQKQVSQEPQPVQIVIEFQGPGLSDPNISWGDGVTMGQIRDAAFLLSTMAQRHIFDQMTEMAMNRAQSQIVVPGAMMGVAGMGGLPS